MAKLLRPLRPAFLIGGLTLLAGCAGHARPIEPAVRTATPTGTIIPGVIAAIRPTTPTPLSQGSTEVLAALQETAPAQPPVANEFVIERSDGNPAAIVIRAPAASPDASLASANFKVGDHIELITGGQTTFIHRTP